MMDYENRRLLKRNSSERKENIFIFNTADLQQKGRELCLDQAFSLQSLHVLPVATWVQQHAYLGQLVALNCP